MPPFVHRHGGWRPVAMLIATIGVTCVSAFTPLAREDVQAEGADQSLTRRVARGRAVDTDTRGRWIPTVSVEQYAATLAHWYGVSAGDIATVFPNIGRFSTPNLGFML